MAVRPALKALLGVLDPYTLHKYGKLISTILIFVSGKGMR
jgi:hypothetical protein